MKSEVPTDIDTTVDFAQAQAQEHGARRELVERSGLGEVVLDVSSP